MNIISSVSIPYPNNTNAVIARAAIREFSFFEKYLTFVNALKTTFQPEYAAFCSGTGGKEYIAGVGYKGMGLKSLIDLSMKNSTANSRVLIVKKITPHNNSMTPKIKRVEVAKM